MNDIDRLLRRSLTAAAESLQPEERADAWARFRARRRRLTVAYAVAAAGVAALVVFSVTVAAPGIRDAAPGPRPAEPGPASPSPRATPQQGTVDPTDVIFVYSASGDIRAQLFDGSVVELTQGPDDDLYPSLSPQGDAVVFQRSNVDEGSGPLLVYRALATGIEKEIGTGSWPSFAPDGRIAWVRPAGAELNEIVIARPFDDIELILHPLPDLSDVRHITWAPDSSAILYEAGQSIVQHSVDEAAQPYPMTPGTVTDAAGSVAFLAPTMIHEDRVEIVNTCCRSEAEGPFSVEIGSILFTEGGPVYETVSEIDPRFLDPAANEYFAVHAGPLRVDGDGSWEWGRPGGSESWLVSDGGWLYLIDEEGSSTFVTDLPGHQDETGGYAGMAVRRPNPQTS